MRKVVIGGTGMTRFGKFLDTSLRALAAEAATAALGDAETEPVYQDPVIRPTWSVFHIQSAVPNARYTTSAAGEFLGYTPSGHPL